MGSKSDTLHVSVPSLQRFKMLDTDGDGKLTMHEYKAVASGFHNADVTATKVSGIVDKDGSGGMSGEEFERAKDQLQEVKHLREDLALVELYLVKHRQPPATSLVTMQRYLSLALVSALICIFALVGV